MHIKQVDVSALDAVMPHLIEDLMGIDPEVGRWIGAYDDGGALLGCARITEVGEARTIDDVWVYPEKRKMGVASALLSFAGSPVWLICDDDMIAFYERRGFTQAEPGDFPAGLAELYGARGEWPHASDHTHHAMVKQ